jgi:hypothetical protein
MRTSIVAAALVGLWGTGALGQGDVSPAAQHTLRGVTMYAKR